MKLRATYRWPGDRAALLRRATRLERATLFWMATILTVMFMAMGSSQAMLAAWIEDLLGLVPAAAWLVARRFERRPPDRDFPSGYQKASSIAYLVAATAVLMLGLYIVFESLMTLVMLDRPSIGLVEVWGVEFWLGWGMIGALAYSIVPPFVLGRMKRPLAEGLHDRVLLADAAMQAADWRTAAAAIAGIVGVGFGLWWADAVAALAIALDVVNDGRRHLAQAVADLSDHTPQTLDRGAEDPALRCVREAVGRLDWVEEVHLRMRTEGRLVTGIVLVRPADGILDSARTAEALRAAEGAHWRVHAPVITPLVDG